jgi:hypothetical protein
MKIPDRRVYADQSAIAAGFGAVTGFKLAQVLGSL